MLAERLGWKADITPAAEPVIDRSLDSTMLRQRSGWEPPSWEDMLAGLVDEARG